MWTLNEIRFDSISTHCAVFAYCRSSRQKALQWLMKTKHFAGFTISVMLREEIKISLCGGRAGSRRGLVGQSRGLLIYTFHKIIHVRGIPLPIWLVRTRVGGVFMELEASQKTERWTNNDVASFPYMQISGLPLTGGLFDSTNKKNERWNFLRELRHQMLQAGILLTDYLHTGLQLLPQYFNKMFKGRPLGADNYSLNSFHDSFLAPGAQQLPLLHFYDGWKVKYIPFTYPKFASQSLQHTTPASLRNRL